MTQSPPPAFTVLNFTRTQPGASKIFKLVARSGEALKQNCCIGIMLVFLAHELNLVPLTKKP